MTTSHPQASEMTGSYSPPVDQLLTLGDPVASREPWADYLAMGLTDEHVAELLRMVGDPALNDADGESAAVWAPLHAWRALGKLRAVAATEPLLDLIGTDSDDDWALGEIPTVLGMIGPAAIGRIVSRLDHADEQVRRSAMSSLAKVAFQHRDAREEVLGILTRRLERWPDQDPMDNAALIGRLIDLGDATAAPLMKAAFDAGAVEVGWNGDWEDVQVELGLIPERTTPRPHYHPALLRLASPVERSPSRAESAKSTAKNRRKAAKASRKRNRRR